MRLQYTHRGTHYERTLRRRHGVGVNVKELIVALVTAADAVSAALRAFDSGSGAGYGGTDQGSGDSGGSHGCCVCVVACIVGGIGGGGGADAASAVVAALA